MTTNQHDYEDKIAKLLAKAEANGTTPAESEALTAAAERLMVKYAIDRATIAAKRSGSAKTEEIITGKINFTGDYRDAYVSLGHRIAEGLGNVRTYTYSGSFNDFRKTGKPIMIVGYESDVEQAKLLINSLQLQAAVAVNVWWKAENRNGYSQSERQRARRDFIESFGGGAASRLRLARKVAEGEAESKAPGTELVLRDRSKDVDDFMGGLGLSQARRSRRMSDYSARQAGYSAGEKANTGGKQVGESRRAIN